MTTYDFTMLLNVLFWQAHLLASMNASMNYKLMAPGFANNIDCI
jgi:hypothetical protein